MSEKLVFPVPRVLVLLASYNGRAWLCEQIYSILAQVGVDVFIQIADDASTDGTYELITQEFSENSKISFFSRTHGSGSAGANFRDLLRESNSEGFDYVAFADQDDIWMPQKLCMAIAALRSSGADGYSCGTRSFWPDGRTAEIMQCPVVRAADFLFEGAGQGCTYVMTTHLFSRVSAFCREQYELCERLHYHDWLVYLLARGWGMAWYFDQYTWISYRQHFGNEIGSRGGSRAIFRRLSMIRNGWYRNQILMALGVAEKSFLNATILVEFSMIFRKNPGFLRRIKLFSFVLINGRRRLSDRLILGVSALAAWI